MSFVLWQILFSMKRRRPFAIFGLIAADLGLETMKTTIRNTIVMLDVALANQNRYHVSLVLYGIFGKFCLPEKAYITANIIHRLTDSLFNPFSCGECDGLTRASLLSFPCSLTVATLPFSPIVLGFPPQIFYNGYFAFVTLSESYSGISQFV